MLNYVHATLHRPERGWDPIPPSHIAAYAAHATETFDATVVPMLDARLGGLAGRRILDLGGGPGDYSIAFARRGARVVWHDVSSQYLRIARGRAQCANVPMNFSLGYLEDARRLGGDFDLVFCRVAWSYCCDDRRFARILWSLVRAGGAGYVECNTPQLANPAGLRKLQYLLNSRLWLKIGHPYPPHGRIEALFRKFPLSEMDVDYSSPLTDKVFFRKDLAS